MRLSLLLLLAFLTGCAPAPSLPVEGAPVAPPQELAPGFGAPKPAPVALLPPEEAAAVRKALDATEKLAQTLERCFQEKTYRCPRARLTSPLSSTPLRMGNGAGIDPGTGEARVELYIDQGPASLHGKSLSWVRYPSDGKWRCFTQGLAARAQAKSSSCS